MPRESFQSQSRALGPGRPGRVSSGRVFRGLLGLVLGTVPSVAQHLPVSRLSTVYPPGGQRGSEVLVTVAGSDLDDLAGLRFSDPRIRAEATSTNAQVFRVTLPADLAPGVVDLRAFGRFGVSNPKGFSIGMGPELLASGTNTTVATAQSLPVEAVVNGRLAANQAAWYRVEVLAGRAYTIRAETRGIDSRLEPILELADPTGRPLGMSRRGVLGFVGPTNGPVLVSVHDVTYRGGDDVLYRLGVTTAPQVERALPVVLQSGATNRVTLWGWNLPGGERVSGTVGGGPDLQRVEVDLVAPEADRETVVEGFRRPVGASVSRNTFLWRWALSNEVSNPVLFQLTPHPVVTGPQPGLVEVTLPVEFSGIFPGRGETNGVRFQGKKDEAWWIDIVSERLGAVTDPRVIVERERAPGESGEGATVDVLELADTDANLGGVDFNTSHRDAAARFVPPADGWYRVRVQNLFQPAPGSLQPAYGLSIRRETASAPAVVTALQLPRQNDNDRTAHPLPHFLRRGETQLVRVVAFRQDGFAGDLELEFKSLPPGVTSMPTRIPSGQNVGFALLTAAEEVKDASLAPEGFPVVLEVRGPGNAPQPVAWSTVSRSIPEWNDQWIPVRPTREAVVSVSRHESAPVTVRSATNRIAVGTDGKFKVPLEVVRRFEFPAAIALKPAGRPEWDKAKTATVPEKATNAVLEFETAELKLPAGDHTVWLQGTVAGKYRNNPEALAAAESDLKANEEALKKASTPAEKEPLEKRKKELEDRRKAAEERAKPRDVNVVVYSQPFLLQVPLQPQKTP